jgi:hypothetical protein
MVLSRNVRNSTKRTVARANERERETVPSGSCADDGAEDLRATVITTAQHGRG